MAELTEPAKGDSNQSIEQFRTFRQLRRQGIIRAADPSAITSFDPLFTPSESSAAQPASPVAA